MMTMFPCGVQPPNFNREVNKSRKAEEWANVCHGVMKSMQDTLAVLYDGVERDEENPAVGGGGDISESQTLLEVANRFAQQCEKLSSILSMPTYGQVRLPLTAVIKVISRCLKVSYTDVKSIPSMTELAEILPTIHQAALQSLSQLILWTLVNVNCPLLKLSYDRLLVCMLSVGCWNLVKPGLKAKLQDRAFTTESDHHRFMFASIDLHPAHGQYKKMVGVTRARTYRVLCLLIETCGWGQYLTRQSRTILQEIMSDVKCQIPSKQSSVSGSQHKKDSLPEPTRKGRKKKRNKAESYSELTAAEGTDENKTVENLTENVEATVQALELAKLTLERVEFSTAENLMRCVLDTAAMLQREGPALNSPYTDSRCRKALYSVVFACVTVKLRPTSNRKDTVTHFQLTNLALSLLTNGQHLDTSPEVKMICRQALNIYRLTGNLNRPIVRRVLPKEDNDMRDVTELEREVDKLSEENEHLRGRLLNSEMENQTQSRLISSLRQEIENLKSAASKHSSLSTQSPTVVSLTTDAQEKEPPADSDDSEAEEDEERQHPKDGLQRQTEMETAQSKTGNIRNTRQESDERGTTVAPAHEDIRKSRKKKRLSRSELVDTAKRKKVETENPVTSNSHHQQSFASGDKPGSSQSKESPVPSCSKKTDSEHSDESDGVQAMISDFVDADPDML